MSWAEVKKINSDLSTPLDKLMSANALHFLVERSTSQLPTLTDILSINGKGELYNVLFGGYYGSGKGGTQQVQVEIDGDIVFDLTLNFSGGSSQGYSNNYYGGIYSSLYYIPIVGPTTGSTQLFFQTEYPVVDFVSTPQSVSVNATSSAGSYACAKCVIPTYIKFDKSLKIKYKATYLNTSWPGVNQGRMLAVTYNLR